MAYVNFRVYSVQFSQQCLKLPPHQTWDDDVPAGRDYGDAVEDDGAVARLHDAALDRRRAVGRQGQRSRFAVVKGI